MAANDRPKLGAAFRSTPDRTSGLGGLLQPAPTAAPPGEPTSEALDGEPSAPTAQPAPASTGSRSSSVEERSAGVDRRRRGRRSGKSRDTRPASSSPAGPEDVPRPVPVVLDAPVLARLREAGRRSGLTHGLIALGAIENHVDELRSRWSSGATTARASGLFGRTQPQHRRSEPGVQTQLRLAAGDADVLDDLVTQWSAPSRSALVNEALLLELGQSTAP